MMNEYRVGIRILTWGHQRCLDVSDALISNPPEKHNPRLHRNRLFRPIKDRSEWTRMDRKAWQRVHIRNGVDNNVRFRLDASDYTPIVAPIVVTQARHEI